MTKKKGFFAKMKRKSLSEWIGIKLTPQEIAKIGRRIEAEEKIALKEFHRQKKLRKVI